MVEYNTATLRADIIGGLVSSAVAIPLCVGFGMFAFVALGDEYFAYGAMAGLFSSVVAKVTSVILGDRSTHLYAPRITTTFFLGLLLLSLVGSADAGESPAATLLKFFAIILLGGVFQALFGAIRLGSLIKFTPHPVMAGFQNMAAVLLFLVQLGNVLGLDHNVKFTHVFGVLDEAQPLSILVAALTFAAMWNARRITAKVPPLLVGLGIGVAAYYTLVLAGLSALLGPEIGPLTASAAMRTVLVDFSDAALAEPLARSAPAILSGALALAFIASIDALLCAKLVSPPGELRAGGDALLVRLGVANAISAGFGGITNGINIGPSVVNRTLGARTALSVLINASVMLAFATVLFPLISLIPRAVLSALIMVVAIQHIDPWTKQVAARLWQRDTPQRSTIALDLGVAMFVSVLSIAINVVTAVFIGVVLAVVLFVVRMGRSNIRRMYRCDSIRSRRWRSGAEMNALREQGLSIVVIELQGALFFGSAERLAQLVDRETAPATARAKIVLLDLRRITEIDSTGARILADIDAALARRDVKLALVLSARTGTATLIADVFHAPDRTFPDVDRAIEWAEDALLNKIAEGEDVTMPLERIPLLRDFAPAQIERLRARLRPMTWPAGSIVFRQGDPGSALFLLTRGRASVYMANDDDRAIRLTTFGPGAVFGELAILDGSPRSATVSADAELEGFALSDASFAILREQDVDVAMQLLATLGRELSVRLRYANLTIQQLEA